MARLLALILGPPLFVGLAYFAARPDVGRPVSPTSHSGDLRTATAQLDASSASGVDLGADSAMVADCQRKREELMNRLGSRFSSVVHIPFVILGNAAATELERHYRETIAPTARALSIAYFDRAPDKPITIVLLADDEAYQFCAERLDGQRRAAFAGYYERNDHRIVVNLDTGAGTIAHELAHALGHFDFPDMPEWFDEGLASLHEEARFSDDRLRIVGVPNWRKRYLLPALQKGTLRSLESLIAEARVRPTQQAVDYAHARFFCLFLQQRGLLESFYRKFRGAVANDPTGLRTLHNLFDVNDLGRIDDEFHTWVRALDLAPPRPVTTRPDAASTREHE